AARRSGCGALIAGGSALQQIVQFTQRTVEVAGVDSRPRQPLLHARNLVGKVWIRVPGIAQFDERVPGLLQERQRLARMSLDTTDLAEVGFTCRTQRTRLRVRDLVSQHF